MEEVNVDGWKGRDEIEINEDRDGYLIRLHRKHKESGQVKTDEIFIERKKAESVWNMINKNCVLRVDYGYRFLVRKYIEQIGIDVSSVDPEYGHLEQLLDKTPIQFQDKFKEFMTAVTMELFNGGKFRNKDAYWGMYYSLKILEKKDYIVFFGKGGIQKIKEGEFR